ncbi:MAG TPA: hypothetical protein VGB85_21875 [Nannocystis sp.]
MRLHAILLSGLSLVAGCRAQAPGAPPVADAARPDPRDVTRPGDDPPMYPASSDGPRIAITSNAYGAYRYAPDAPQLGDTLADFALPNARGGSYALREARAKGPVVLVFYRGFW